ncbi:IclR family transcriptional regulator [Pseudonocardia kongjuensis]|uniref:IclR family transcriptional regulator n=1 Tax=Pseudonocardia kongjuensis TaxID=102227 RepID=UPI0031E3EC24
MGSAEHLPTSVLRRAFSLLEVLGAADRSMGMAELAKRAGMPKATAYRMANQLVELQVIDRVGNEYRIGLKLFQLDARARHQEMREVALPFLEDLQAIVQETVHLGVLDGSEVLYLERVAGRGVPTGTPARGSRGELHCSALGKVMLAHLDGDLVQRVLQEGLTRRTPFTISTPGRLLDALDRARATGVAYEHEEHELGVTGVASPVFDRQGRGRAAISVTGPSSAFRPERVAAVVRAAAQGLQNRWLTPLRAHGSR